jgi:hypothetical protein
MYDRRGATTMILQEVRAIRSATSRRARAVALLHVRRNLGPSAGTVAEARPVWFAMLTCTESDLKILWKDYYIKRWWALNAPMLAGMFRLAPDKVTPTHEDPAPWFLASPMQKRQDRLTDPGAVTGMGLADSLSSTPE